MSGRRSTNGTADRNCEFHHGAGHRFLLQKRWAVNVSSLNVASPFIDHSSEMWKFPPRRRVSADLAQ
jgi:hypothetical protein